MTAREQYQLSFQKQPIPNGFYYFVDSKLGANNDIANHITDSNMRASNSQIKALSDAMAGLPIQEDWGEVFGSALEIHTSTGMAEIGDGGTIIPIHDLKQLFEEWVGFISQ